MRCDCIRTNQNARGSHMDALKSSPIGDDRTRMRQNRIGVRANRMESVRIVSECKRIVYDWPRIVVNCVRIERECVMIVHECIVLISEYMRTVQECRNLWDFPHPQSCRKDAHIQRSWRLAWVCTENKGKCNVPPVQSWLPTHPHSRK